MDPNAEQIDWSGSRGESGVERGERRGVLGRIRADLGRPPRRGRGSAVIFALSCALVGSAAAAYLVTGDEPRMSFTAALAAQWFLAAADVLPVRFRRTAPALRALCLGLFAATSIGWWLA